MFPSNHGVCSSSLSGVRIKWFSCFGVEKVHLFENPNQIHCMNAAVVNLSKAYERV